MTVGRFITRVRRRVLPGLRHLPSSEWRTCGCCGRRSLIVALSSGDEFRRCVRCGASPRYELLAAWIREHVDLPATDALELDPRSPLRQLLAGSRTYLRSYFSDDPSAPPPGGGDARNLDIQRLDLPDASLDLIVSSEVLEHVPDLHLAFAEMRRVLRPGGRHVFTVPPRERTLRRAEVTADGVRHLAEPEYHGDPLRPDGILCFWDLGIQDGAEVFSLPGLALSVVAGPAGRDGRVVWAAERSAADGQGSSSRLV